MAKDDEVAEDELDRSYKLGISSGLERASGLLLKKATEYFERKDDDNAKLLRDLSDELKKMSKEAHPGTRSEKKK